LKIGNAILKQAAPHSVANLLLIVSAGFKIGQYFVKIWTRVWCLFDSRCRIR